MVRFTQILAATAILSATFACSDKTSKSDEPSGAPSTNKATEKTPATMDDMEIPAGLEGLDDADRVLALKQSTCPVSGEPLGEMGTPVKKVVGDRVVFLCCASCNKKFDADPQKYVAKIDSGE